MILIEECAGSVIHSADTFFLQHSCLSCCFNDNAFCLSFRNQQVLQKLDADTVDPNSNYAKFEKSLKNSHDECFPMRVVKFNPRDIRELPALLMTSLNRSMLEINCTRN